VPLDQKGRRGRQQLSLLVVQGACDLRSATIADSPRPNRIREIRQRRALEVPAAFTVAEVARRVGVQPETMWRWEHGVTKPTPRHARRLAQQLGVTIDDLHLEPDTAEEDGPEE
jgi:DNA-binding XRE family transcriptional regulator